MKPQKDGRMVVFTLVLILVDHLHLIKMSENKIIIFIVFIIVFILLGIGSYLYISKVAPDYFTLKSEITFENTSQFKEINEKYIGKVVEISGEITDVDSVSPFINITLDSCYVFSFEMTNIDRYFILGEKIKVKSRFIGYDDMFDEYTFTDCDILQ